MWTHSLKDALGNVGAVLILFSGLAAASVFAVRWRRPDLPRPRPLARIAAAVYVIASGWTLVFGFRRLDPKLLVWMGAIAALAVAAYLATVRVARRPA